MCEATARCRATAPLCSIQLHRNARSGRCCGNPWSARRFMRRILSCDVQFDALVYRPIAEMPEYELSTQNAAQHRFISIARAHAMSLLLRRRWNRSV